jgi:hypothetical protein
MTDIDNLNIGSEDFGEIGEVNYNLPESGSFAPAVSPGVHTGVFKLAEQDPFEHTDIEIRSGVSQKFAQVTYLALIPVQNGAGATEEHEVNFLRTNWYVSDKMKQANMQSSAAELTRSLGIRIEGKLTVQRWQDALRHADGRARFTAEYGWELYCRSCRETTVSTTPRKKRGQIPWPRKSDGTPELMARCPKCKGAPAYGSVRIVRYKLPEQQAQTVSTAVAASPVVSEDSIPF